MHTLIALLLASAAHAQSCDAKKLAKDLETASPVAVPKLFLELAACDPAAANKSAALAMGKTLAGDEGNQAALAALKAGAQKPVMDWVDGLEPDHRSAAMLWFGDQCAQVPEVGQFFVDSAAQKTDIFLRERWYRGMSKCRVEGVQNLLRDIVEKDSLKLNRESRFGLLEVYARNLGKAAIPHLKATALQLGDPKEIRLVLNAFGDAANVGAVEGLDQATAKEAIAAIEELAPQTHPEAVEQVRDTLAALGAPEKGDAVVKYRWPDRFADGSYAWAVVATEEATCKNGKVQVVLHHGLLTSGDKWPDTLKSSVEAAATTAWGLDAAAKCKGTGTTTVVMSTEPMSSEESLAEFVKANREAYDKAAKTAWKAEEIAEDTAPF